VLTFAVHFAAKTHRKGQLALIYSRNNRQKGS